MNKNYIEIHDNQEILNLEIHAVGKRENKNFTLRTVPALSFKNGVCRIKCVLQTAIDIQRIVESQQGFICNLGHDWEERLEEAKKNYLIKKKEKEIRKTHRDADVRRQVELEEFRRARELKEMEDAREAFEKEEKKKTAKKTTKKVVKKTEAVEAEAESAISENAG